jgi:hypothetical protein
MVELDEEPVNAAGILSVTDELAKLLKPLMEGRDNIAVRFMADGLPTTATAVISEMYIRLGGTLKALRWYSVRSMIFETTTGKTGVNVYFRPVRTELFDRSVQQDIVHGPVYNFQEVYETDEESSRDMERLLAIAEANFSKSQGARNLSSSMSANKSWLHKVFNRKA